MTLKTRAALSVVSAVALVGGLAPAVAQAETAEPVCDRSDVIEARLSHRIDRLDGRLDRLAARVEHATQRLADHPERLEHRLAHLEGRIRRVTHRQERIDARIDALQGLCGAVIAEAVPAG